MENVRFSIISTRSSSVRIALTYPKAHIGGRRHYFSGYAAAAAGIDSNIFFEIKESKITRGHNYTLVKKQSRLDVRKYSFSQRTINVWNNLSTDCVQASSVNMFKNKIDKYLVKAGYT